MDSQSNVSPALIHLGNALDCYADWPAPVVILSDGAYGLGKFPGEPNDPSGLPDWYAAHVEAWSRHALPSTTLWFWNTEIGWALTHPLLAHHGWQYRECCVWDKGVQHLAGNCNGHTIRSMPVVTEVCVRYTREATLKDALGNAIPVRNWLRNEWERSGLPLARADEACGVAKAATRRYLKTTDMWYCPSGEAVVKMADYCARHGHPSERPYFSVDGITPVSADAWEATWQSVRPKWNYQQGVTNVWRESAVRGAARFRTQGGDQQLSLIDEPLLAPTHQGTAVKDAPLHPNQKPLSLYETIILASSDPGDTVWEPFGGLCPGMVAALRHGRIGRAAEQEQVWFGAAALRVNGVSHKN